MTGWELIPIKNNLSKKTFGLCSTNGETIHEVKCPCLSTLYSKNVLRIGSGIIHLINAIPHLDGDIQIVLCAAVPDTEAIDREMKEKIEKVRGNSKNQIIWISEVLPKDHLAVLYSHASVFVCPSVYEPFGIINLEAMACNTPVVASAVGGIPDAVVHNETGLLVDFEPVSSDNSEPMHPERFSRDLAAAINQLLGSPEKMKAMGIECRKRVEQHFSWESIARQTLAFYHDLIRAHLSP